VAIGDDAIRDAFYFFTQQAEEMDDKGLLRKFGKRLASPI
jgi:hypothetical protein